MQTFVRSESFGMSIVKQLKSIISRVVLDMQLESYLDSRTFHKYSNWKKLFLNYYSKKNYYKYMIVFAT